jgi:hypothetical protein
MNRRCNLIWTILILLIQFAVVVLWEMADDILNEFKIRITDTMDSHFEKYSDL